MSFLSSLFGKKRTPCEKMVVQLIETGNKAHFMKEMAKNQGGAKFESALITSLFLLKHVNSKHKNEYKTVEKYTFGYLYELSDKYNVRSFLNMDLSDFMNLRFEQYTKELDFMLDRQGEFIPTKTLYNLYDTPLKSKSGDFIDPFTVMTFTKQFLRFLNITIESTPLIAGAAKIENSI